MNLNVTENNNCYYYFKKNKDIYFKRSVKNAYTNMV